MGVSQLNIILLLLALKGITTQQSDSDNMVFQDDCSSTDLQVWHSQTQQCETLLTEANCGEGNWLVLSDDQNATPKCVKMPCDTPKEVKVKNQTSGVEQCYAVKNTTPCPPGMMVTVSETGKGECDCMNAYVYLPQRDNVTRTIRDQCQPLFKRGSCPSGHITFIRRGEKLARCHHNACPENKINVRVSENGVVRLPLGNHRVLCLGLNESCPRPDGTTLSINASTNELQCTQPDIRNRVVIDAPLINCAPGSRRDALGRCRRAV